MNSNLGGSYIVSNFKNTANNVKFIKPATLHGGGTALRSRTPMVNRAATMTPGPGSYMLPSDFGYLEQRDKQGGSPRNNMSTQGSTRPRIISRLQLSTMTDNVAHNMGGFSPTPYTATDRERLAGGSMQVKKRNDRGRMNSTFMRMRTVDMTGLDGDSESIKDHNQLTTRE